MKATLEYRNEFLCVAVENDSATRFVAEWKPVRRAEYAEVRTLLGRPVTSIDQREGIYIDEEGNVYQLMDKGETKPIAVEDLSAEEKSELEVLLEASLNGRRGDAKKRRAQAALEKESKQQP